MIETLLIIGGILYFTPILLYFYSLPKVVKIEMPSKLDFILVTLMIFVPLFNILGIQSIVDYFGIEVLLPAKLNTWLNSPLMKDTKCND